MVTSTPTTKRDIRIRQFRDADLPEVTRLFAEGMMAYSLDPKLEHRWVDYIDKSKQTDLADVYGTYMAPGGNFWVATLAESDGSDRVVGMVALEAKPEGHGELRRLSVDSSLHRMGVGRRLVAHLEDWAILHGFKSIELHASHQRQGPLAFYRRQGYRHVRTLAFWENPLYEAFAMVKQLQ
jgi:ribosomal protein S18 acetylase RimI-like enzyme